MRPSPALSPAVRRLVAGETMSAVGTGLVLPLTLIYLHDVRHIPLTTTGLLLAIPGVLGLLVVPLTGVLLDRAGPRPVLQVLLLLQAVAQVGLALARTPLAAAGALAVQGLALAPSFPAFNTLLGALTPDAGAQQRAYAVNFTCLNAGIGLGGLVGASVVSVHRPSSFQALFVANAVAGLLFAVLAGTVPTGRRAAGPHEPSGSYRAVLANPALRRVVGLSVLVAFTGYAALDSGLPAFATVDGHVGVRLVALSLAVNTGLIVAAQLVVLRLLRGRRRSRSLSVVGLVWAVSWAVFGASALPASALARGALVLVFAGLFGVGETFLAPSLAPLVNDLAGEAVRGRANALSSGTYSLAFVVSPALSAGLIAAGLAWLWIALLVVGSLASALTARRLGRRLSPAQDGVGAPLVPTPEPQPV